MDKIIKIAAALIIIVVLGCGVFFFNPLTQLSSSATSGAGRISNGSNVTVYFFYGEECSHCHAVMPFIRSLEQKYPEVDIRVLEIWHNEANYVLSTSLNQRLGIKNPGVPEVIIGDVALFGERDIPARLESVILEQLKKRAD